MSITYNFTAEWDPSLTRLGDPRIELFQPDKYVLQVLTLQENWVRQGHIRDSISLELWYGRYQKLPMCDKMELQAIAGDTPSGGSEVLTNGCLSVSVDGAGYESLYPDTPLDLGPMFTNSKKALVFRLLVPEDAETKEYFFLELQLTPKFMRGYGTFPWGVGIYLDDRGFINFHPNNVIYRAYVFDAAMWAGLEETGIITSPLYRGEDKKW